MVEINPSQSLGWQGLAEALAARGLAGRLVETSPLCVQVDAHEAAEVAHALEAWLLDRGSPLLPQIVDAEHIVLRPAAA